MVVPQGLVSRSLSVAWNRGMTRPAWNHVVDRATGPRSRLPCRRRDAASDQATNASSEPYPRNTLIVLFCVKLYSSSTEYSVVVPLSFCPPNGTPIHRFSTPLIQM